MNDNLKKTLIIGGSIAGILSIVKILQGRSIAKAVTETVKTPIKAVAKIVELPIKAVEKTVKVVEKTVLPKKKAKKKASKKKAKKKV